MKGSLTSDHAACVEIQLLEASGTHEFIVDTGFSDFLYLPEDVIADWSLPFVMSIPAALADGSLIIADVFEANIIWLGSMLRITALSGPSGCDSLIGMSLLEGCRIELDRAKKEVRIEPL